MYHILQLSNVKYTIYKEDEGWLHLNETQGYYSNNLRDFTEITKITPATLSPSYIQNELPDNDTCIYIISIPSLDFDSYPELFI